MLQMHILQKIAQLQDIVYKTKAHDTHTIYIAHIYIWNPPITVHI